MKEKIIDSIGRIDDDLIESVDALRQKKHTRIVWLKLGVAVCLCVLACVVIAAPEIILQENPESGTSPVKQYTSPVNYSDLLIPERTYDTGSSTASLSDITSFDESALESDNCSMIVEGTITNVYTKHYKYDIYDDKFEKNGVLHAAKDTVVYELLISKTWYGRDVSGETILVEDVTYFLDNIYPVVKGGKYVLPLYEYGDTLRTIHEWAGGDISRESRYSTIYPYHPQIEVTKDGWYIVSNDWTTLISQDAVKIDMDTMESDNYYYDKMYLIDKESFERQMNLLISQRLH
ncbi:MAG: hypothetical protein ACI4D0_04785 [Lachnospira sp.]